MKNRTKNIMILAALVLALFSADIQAQEYKVITVVESIVPGGLGRSRMVEMKSEIDVNEFTTERTDGKKSDQGDIKRGDAKIDAFAETKLLNFYSLVGINFQNIASNDALISSKLNQLTKDGWKLAHVLAGVESDAGAKDRNGIFITRYIFER